MNENKKTIVVLSIVVAIILLIPLTYYINYSKGEKIVKAVDELFAAEEINLVFIGRPTCSYCTKLQPIIDGLAEDYDFTYNYVNTDKLNKNQMKKVVTKFGQDINNFGTPYLAVIKNGKKVAEQPGYVEAEELFKFLQDNGIIDEKEVLTAEETNLTVIDYTEYNKILSDKTKEIIVLAQTGCSACETAKPVLDGIAAEYKVKINWFDIKKLTTETDYNAFMSSLSYLKDEEWGTPLTIIVENNKVVASSNGFLNEKAYVDFLEENGFIK